MTDRPDLATGRLLLRRPVHADRSAIAAICGRIEVSRGLARVPHPYTEADADFFLEEIVPRDHVWAVVPHGADTLAGMIGLSPEPGAATAELGYWFAPEVWGLGYATEAGRAVIDFGFGALGLPFLVSGHFVRNPASGRVLAKLGFIVTGAGVRSCLALNEEVESVEMRLDRAAA